MKKSRAKQPQQKHGLSITLERMMHEWGWTLRDIVDGLTVAQFNLLADRMIERITPRKTNPNASKFKSFNPIARPVI